MKYQDIHDILNPPRDYQLDEVLDKLFEKYQNMLKNESGEFNTLDALPSKKQRAELDRIAGVLKPAVELFDEKGLLYATNLLIASGAYSNPQEAGDAREVAGRALRDALYAVKSFQMKGKGAPRKDSARWLVSHLGVLYEHFGGRATSNNDFLDFCEQCFRHAGTELFNPYSEGDGRATLKGLVNFMNRKNKKTGTTWLYWCKNSEDFLQNLRLKK